MKEMLEFGQALDEVLSRIEALEAETSHISDCLGQVMAEDIYAGIDVPPQDIATRDGYAVRSADVQGASPDNPRRLRVTDAVFAGSSAKQKVAEGTAIRIMTGVPVPDDADSIVCFEDTREVEPESPECFIEVLRETGAGSNILGAGGHITKGSLLVSKGMIVRPMTINLLASSGIASVSVTRRPVVAIIATGEELVELGETLTEDQVYNSNIYGLAASVLRCGGIPEMMGIAGDNEAATIGCIHRSMDADIIITSGGSSKGDRDLIKPIIARLGEIVFSKVRTSPGMPFSFGLIEDSWSDGRSRKIPLFALPGVPSGCFVSFEMFARPAILKLAGKSRLAPPTIEARMAESFSRKKNNMHLRWVKVKKRNGEYIASHNYVPDSGIMTSMAYANGLVIVPEGRNEIRSGEKVKVIILDWQEENFI